MISLPPDIYTLENPSAEKKLRNILVIDDDLDMLEVMNQVLVEIPDLELRCTDDPRTALKILQEKSFNVVITDIMMPGLTGVELLEQINMFDPEIQVILMTGYEDTTSMRRAIQLGASDFLRKPFSVAELVLTVRQALNKNRLIIENKHYRNNLEQLVEERTVELLSAKNQLKSLYLKTIQSMINAIEVTDTYTAGHSQRVTIISTCLGKLLHLSAEELDILQIGAALHDLGKIGKISTIVSKNARVSPMEYAQIKDHPIHGAKIIAPLGLPAAVHDIIIQHHEWIDGSGYPYSLRDVQISYFAKIVSVADAYDAMTSRRAYRSNLSPTEASLEIRRLAGSQFDPAISEMFYQEFEQIQAALK